MPIRTIGDVHQFLDSLPTFKAEGRSAADFSLERFRRFCISAGNPQDAFPSIHVAGSNGKGSTCQLLASIYRQAGYRVGVYTSPHVLDYEERFVVNGRQIGGEDLLAFFRQHEEAIREAGLTYFEISTMVAFWWFARRQVDVALIETGLGGRLDATNIIRPLASVITTVTLDHTEILGDSIEAIAEEKAGIIKAGIPVITGNLPAEARRVIRSKARAEGAPLTDAMALQPDWEQGHYILYEGSRRLELTSGLRAPVQANNIAVAWQVTRVLQKPLPVTDAERRSGVRQAGTSAAMPGRFERLAQGLQWYFDGAHNLQAVQAMKQSVSTLQPVNETVLVLALMDDKVTEKLMAEFSEFKKIIYHTVPLGRAAALKKVRAWLPRVQAFPVENEARKSLLKELETELVIFAGSFYFYSTVRDWLSSYKIDR